MITSVVVKCCSAHRLQTMYDVYSPENNVEK